MFPLSSSAAHFGFFSPHRPFPSSWIHLFKNFLFLSLSTMLDFVFPEIVHHIGFIFPLCSWSLLGVSFSLKLSNIFEFEFFSFTFFTEIIHHVGFMFLLSLLAIDLFFHPPSFSELVRHLECIRLKIIRQKQGTVS